MKQEPLVSMTELAENLGVYTHTVMDLVAKLGIETTPLPRNARARGLNRAAVRRIRKALGMTGRAQAVAN